MKLELNEITLGSLRFMNTKGCKILNGNANIDSFIEFLFIHSRDIKTLRKMTDEEYSEALDDFTDSIALDDLPEITKAANEKMQKLIDSKFVQSEGKKKSV